MQTKTVWYFVLVFMLLFIVMPAAAQQMYVVQPGDTLASIAQRHSTTAAAIASANGILNPNIIYAGQTLRIPSGSTGGTGAPTGTTIRYIVKQGDTLSQIAVNYNTTVEAIQQATGLTRRRYIYPGEALLVPVGTYVPPASSPVFTPGRWYTVRPGDTMFRIGTLFGVNIYRIAEANGILNLNRIYSGVPLFIPNR